MRKIAASLLTFLLLTSIVPAASAKPKGDWNGVEGLAGQAVAVKTRDGVTSFGVLGSADDTGMDGLKADPAFAAVFRRELSESQVLERQAS